MDKKVVIATHDGMFHPDDIFAVATLLCLLEKTPVLTTVIRTRDEDRLRKADFVVDVGGAHDEKNNRFDHHQAGGAGKRANGISFAAFGLVWQKYGKDIAGSEKLAASVDQKLVSSIDAGDNGIDIYKKNFDDVEPYLVGDFFHNLRPTWQESIDSLDTKFLEAVAIARQILTREIEHSRGSLEAEKLVIAAYESSKDKRVVVLDAFYPHQKTLGGFSEPLFVVHPRPDGKWNVGAIRDDEASFKNRKNLPEAWAGKRDAELASVTGVPDAVFCHNGRFMAVAQSKAGAIKLAELALSS
ncbi:MAG: MYG1 family protein [Patescibacteria group bacterium]